VESRNTANCAVCNALLLLMLVSMEWGWVSEQQPIPGLLFIPQVTYECGEPRWNDTNRETEERWERSAPVPLCPLQILQILTLARSRASALRGWRLTAQAMVRSVERRYNFSSDSWCLFFSLLVL
jgi:hypothetical protein